MRWISTRAPYKCFLQQLLGFLLLLGPLVGWAQAPPNQGLVADSTELRVLRQLYRTSDGPHWGNNANWPTTESAWAQATLAQAAGWAGIGVANGDVVTLYLNAYGLRGTLPPDLGKLTQLTYLNLCNNRSLVGALPPSIGQLRQLVQFFTINSSLSGSLPPELGQLSHLQTLSLGRSNFSGPIPPELGQLSELLQLGLANYTGDDPTYYNDFSGGIPPELGNLRQLRELNISCLPHLGGRIPATLGQLSQLTFLELDGNNHSGPIPAELGNLRQLRELYLYSNRLNGSLPAALGNLSSLGRAEFAFNALTGTIPASLLRLPQLGYAGLRSNEFTAIESLGSTTSLPVTVSVTNNRLGFADLERLYRGAGQPRVASTELLDQRPPTRQDTVRYQVGEPLALTVKDVAGQATYHYQWQRLVGGQWLPMPGDTLLTKRWASASAAEQGTYRLALRDRWFTNPALAPTELYSATVYADLIPYQLLSRNYPDDKNQGLGLTKPLAAVDATASKPADMNYVRTWIPRVALTSTEADPAAQAQTQAVAAAAAAAPGSLRYERWASVYGATGLDILPRTNPTATQAVTSFEAPTGQGNDYGARLRGYLLPPVTGDYTFWLTGDDQAQLWLSPDENPMHARPLAALSGSTGSREWTKFAEQRSVAVTLVAGKRYYVEALHHQDGGGDGVAVAWVRPDQPGASPSAPINSLYLAPVPATIAPLPANPVGNPSFEADGQQTYSVRSWLVSPGRNTAANASYVERNPLGHSGAYHGTHYRPDAYEVYTYQTLTGLAPGTYTLSAWVRSGDGRSRSQLQARAYGGAVRTLSLAGASANGWVRVDMPNLLVSTGQCEIGIYSQADAGQALYFDDITLTQQDGGPVPATQAVTLANAGFEAGGQASSAPQGWRVTPGANTNTNASYSETYPSAHTGSYHGTHYRPDAYEVYTSQTLTGLAAGTYTLRAWVRSSDGNSKSQLRARADGGIVQSQSLASAPTSNWTQVSLENLVVKGGQLEVGVYSQAAAGQALYFDDFTLDQQLPAAVAAVASWSVDQAQITTQYLDGLGRPVQTVLHQATPSKKYDLVQPQAYDALGREPNAYLPYAADTAGVHSGNYRYQALTQQQNFYYQTTLPNGTMGPPTSDDPTRGVARTGMAFAETVFEASPLNRITAQGAAGEAWQLANGHAINRQERPNVTQLDSVPRFNPGYNPKSLDPGYQGYYADGELWGTEIADAHGPTEVGVLGYRTIEWKDKLGQVVCKQVEANRVGTGTQTRSRWLRTAYVYDDFQRLRFVLQPEATKRLPLANQAAALPAAALPFLFHYRYDGRGRQIAKQVPGQDGETLVVYDQLDRPVLSQDAQQRTRKEWSWTKYDVLGRMILSGLATRQDTLGQVSLQNRATADTATVNQYEQRSADKVTYPHFYTTVQSFPKLGIRGNQGFSEGQVLSVTYYDDYNFDNDAAGTADASYATSTDNRFSSGQAPVADAARTQGLTTRTKTRVLGVAENDQTGQAAWLTTTTFYDERARPVQVQTTNARKNLTTGQQFTDLLTTQLDFTGKVVQSVAVHQGPGLTTPILVKETFTYDHMGRLLSTRQQLPGEKRAALLDTVTYNEIGQVTRKTLATGRLKQDVDYAYNIRGWLTSLNDPAQPDPADLFNLSLHYERGFTKGYDQYNGNLTGQTWRGRDGVQRAYGYVQDPLNRILQGDFVARAGGSLGTLSTATAWNQELDNYRLSFVSYDDNGNIRTLRRQGLLQNATHLVAKRYGAVDNLTYAYQGNRLLTVDDAITGNQLPRPKNYNGAPTSLAGDFQEASVKLGEEYLYDANGNLLQDKNKGITGILYNHLNLPRQIRFGNGADSIVFRYTAAGQKVAKLVYQTGKPLARTDYLGPYQYEQDSLKFFPHAEGRVLRFVSYDPAGQEKVSYQREFTFKDHLGNLRLAYRAGQVRTLLATLEQDENTHKREAQQFDSLSVSQPVAVQTPHAHGAGNWAARLNASTANGAPQPLGPLTQLGVQKGDTVTVQAFGYYSQTVQHGFLFSLGSFLANLFNPAQAPPPGLEAQRRKGFPLLQAGVAAGLASIPQLSGGVPKGYLRVLVFNKDSALVRQRTWQLSQAANGGYEPLGDTVRVSQDGYVTVYVGNESDVDVLFDDMSVEQRHGLQVQENQYDPWGISLAGVDYSSPGIQGLNQYQFNGKERQSDLGLSWQSYGWRMYDVQLGTWHSIDQLASTYNDWSPYNYVADNPTIHIDPDGRFIGTLVGGLLGGIAGGVRAAIHHENVWAGAGKGALVGLAAGAVFDITVATAGTGTLALVGAGALSGATSSALEQQIETGKIDAGKVVLGAAVGGVLGFAGAKVAPYLSKAAGAAWNGLTSRYGSVSVGELTPEVLPYSELNGGATLPEVMKARPDYSLIDKFFKSNIKETIPLVRDATRRVIQGKVDVYNTSGTNVPEGLTKQTLELYKQQAEMVLKEYVPGSSKFLEQTNRIEAINSALTGK
jgi:RHS repeat-associated protein